MNEEDLQSEIVAALERSAERIVDIEKRLAVLETDQRELEQAVRSSLDQIQKGMGAMLQFMREYQKPRQAPTSGLLN